MDDIVGATDEARAEAETHAHRALADDWMELVADDHPRLEYDDWVEAHRVRWEETRHFADYYGRELDRIVEEDFRRQGGDVESEDRGSTGYFEVRAEVYDRFWSIWEQAKSARTFWREHYGNPDLRLLK